MNLVAVTTFLELVLAALAAGFVTSNLTGFAVLTALVPRGRGRSNAADQLFKTIWSWGLVWLTAAALVIAGCCLALCSTVAWAFATACVTTSALAAILLTVLFL